MLANTDAIATVGVRDMAAARTFYGEVLALREDSERSSYPDFLTYRSGATRVQVYQSDYAGTNKATAITWDLGSDLAAVVAALAAKGVRFEHYDMPGMRLEGDIHVADGMKAAWLKDPDGNVLNLNGT
ncbi:VOC family protein [Massilia sp. Leaf139]|uniref:VOC family protein n=1 Tax=Massilia sp. Leaf139 TaxID=1736272 RepID=UPI0006F4DE58|nr:VOC family protein [Massilia sp. Leaf139]KQQ92054.1 glyoxalase [Massilia sp. Leaf139]